AQISAEINGHGDLLVLLDTDGSGGPEIVLHGAPQAGSELDAVIGALEGRSAPMTVRLLSRSSAASGGFEIATGPGKRPVRALVGTPDCFPDESGTVLWLAGLARYTLSNFQPLAYLTIERLRASALIQRGD
ncbi:MAG: hypothetical protein GVY32_07685, partial [Gammaproteobacteria bacterium]|nr:hypothetical protein [Gammaproteobacteria bacterium]